MARPKAEDKSKSANKKETGRPTVYTKALGEKICSRIADGESLRSICSNKKMPNKSTVLRWLISEDPKYKFFCDQYEKAREIQYQGLADEIFDVADDGRNDWMERNGEDSEGWVTNGEALQRSRLRVDTRKWFLSKVLPKFADRREVNLSGQIEHKHKDLSDEELASRVRQLEEELKGKDG